MKLKIIYLDGSTEIEDRPDLDQLKQSELEDSCLNDYVRQGPVHSARSVQAIDANGQVVAEVSYQDRKK